jgi:RsmE family RNA methyltransferase
MNLLLLREEDLLEGGKARLTGRRLLHAREVLRAMEGDVLRVGRLGGGVGTGQVLSLTESELVLRCDFAGEPPGRPGVDLLLAMPRPKALRRILPAAASLGVDRIVLVQAARVEKSYFDSHVLAQVEDLLILGLEQARDTRMPLVTVRDRFRPFVEDELETAFPPAARLLAHLAAERTLSPALGRIVLAIGPEGGWVPFEVKLLEEHGFAPITLGPRPLRVEVALPYALGAICDRRSR